MTSKSTDNLSGRNPPPAPGNLQEKDIGPWYKQFWAWFVLMPLIAVVIAWIPFMTLALTGADDVVIDNYYKEGRMINQRVDEDRRARELGLHGSLAVDLAVGDLVVTLATRAPDYTLPETLELSLDHPLEADLDRTIALRQVVPGRYQGELSRRLQDRWYVRLLPPAADSEGDNPRWRLTGELDLSQSPRLILGDSRLTLDE